MPQGYLGGGGGVGPTYHTTDGNTLAHWKFDGDLVDDSANEVDVSGTYRVAPFNQLDLCTRLSSADNYSVNGLGASPIKTSGAITCAMWIFPLSHPSSNSALAGFRGGGSSGSPDNFNFPWEIQWMSTGNLKFFWQSDLKDPNETGTWALPLEEWVHVMGTRTTAGTAAELYINGVEEASVTGATQHNGGGSLNDLRILNNGLGPEGQGYVASLYITGAHSTAADAETLYKSAKL